MQTLRGRSGGTERLRHYSSVHSIHRTIQDLLLQETTGFSGPARGRGIGLLSCRITGTHQSGILPVHASPPSIHPLIVWRREEEVSERRVPCRRNDKELRCYTLVGECSHSVIRTSPRRNSGISGDVKSLNLIAREKFAGWRTQRIQKECVERERIHSPYTPSAPDRPR